MCDFCEGTERMLYSSIEQGDMYFVHDFNKTYLSIKPKICPEDADCLKKNKVDWMVFKIKYCPECGRKI